MGDGGWVGEMNMVKFGGVRDGVTGNSRYLLSARSPEMDWTHQTSAVVIINIYGTFVLYLSKQEYSTS
jgi:hypothetical protein